MADFQRLLNSLHSLFFISQGRDDIIWTLTPSGKFSVASLYKNFSSFPSPSKHFSRSWSTIAPPIVQAFNWLAFSQKALSVDQVQRRGVPILNKCVLCECEEETNSHLFLLCAFSSDLWGRGQLFCLQWVTPPSVKGLLTINFESSWPKAGRILWKATLAATIWLVWMERNSRFFRGTELSIPAIFQKVTILVTFWASNMKFLAGIPRSFFLSQWGNILHHQPAGAARPSLWLPPNDGCSLKNPGPLGSGGVLRDFEGNILITFSDYLGIKDSHDAEALALLLALKKFNSS
ncbi:hypothetical protein AMTRI_Chr13g87770 [Amborella trichopoda]